MQNRIAIVALLLGVVAKSFAGDVSGYSAGQHVDVIGRVFLRGNAPFLYPAIQTKAGVVWVLDGVEYETVRPWLGKPVQVSGTVSRWSEAESILPVIDVDSFQRPLP